MNKVDQAISVIQFILKKKKKRIESLGRKIQPSESEKIFIGQEVELCQNVEILITAMTKELDKNLGKIPPQATDLEESILGAIILDSSVSRVSGFLKAEHFYLETNSIIYTTILSMSLGGHPVDMRTIVAYLRKAGRLEVIGGAHRIAELTSKVSSTANLEAHARILIEYAIKRELIRLAGDTLSDGYDDTVDCFDMVDKASKSIKEIEGWIK